MRFTQQIREQHALGLMIRVGSLLEAEAWIDVSAQESTALIIVLDQGLCDQLLDERVRYLREYIEARGAVVGIGYYSDGSEPQARMALLAGCSYVQVECSGWSLKDLQEKMVYLTRLAHSMDACVEAIIGQFQDGSWKSPLTTEFDIKRFVVDSRVDALGVVVPEGVVGNWKKSGKIQLNEDFFHAIALKTQSMITIHGASLGSSWVPKQKVYASHPYHQVTGISEQALMRIAEKGARYLCLEHDLRNIVDMGYRGGSPGSGIGSVQALKDEYYVLITRYLTHCNKLVAKTYAL